MRLLPALALALTACLAPPPGWTVTGGTPAQHAQALALVMLPFWALCLFLPVWLLVTVCS